MTGAVMANGEKLGLQAHPNLRAIRSGSPENQVQIADINKRVVRIKKLIHGLNRHSDNKSHSMR